MWINMHACQHPFSLAQCTRHLWDSGTGPEFHQIHNPSHRGGERGASGSDILTGFFFFSFSETIHPISFPARNLFTKPLVNVDFILGKAEVSEPHIGTVLGLGTGLA